MKNLFISAILAMSSIVALAQGTANNPYLPFQSITSGNMSGNITSSAIYKQDYPNCGIQYIWTGSPTGTLGVSVSQNGAAGTYTPLTITGGTQPSGSAGMWYLDLTTFAQYIEITYTASSGSGSLNTYVGCMN